jgi:hypothetical protein
MSFKKYIDELREKSCKNDDLRGKICKNAEEACIQYIQQLICIEIQVHPRIKEIKIKYDDIFTSDMYTIVKNYLIKEKFRVRDYLPFIEDDYIPYGIVVILDDLI